ncbi:AAA-like domain-containing protein [Oscillochloris sp. ZM17-4]|uniref:AAA-like domain-containing protein n=1 Tax=Oscillochloris sp. ZM17-4 TaxID=2866714 RepID=UPI001C73A184|nr:AAA-like domain-containing protein [Oscillochloris sp. ZM17-4]MBX0331277.1 AAA-like domain-containing protein [Oscillochloris sp. ZM17-4]
MSTQNIYTVGGTVQAGQGIYVPRKADDELRSLCQAGTFAYILTARQMGKSSLMVRTAARLEEEGTHTALIDLTKLGAKASAEQWYLGFLVELADQLGLATDVMDWWTAQEHLPMAQRLSRFCTKVVLDELIAPVVIFVDEIDSTLSLDFTDDFFAAIRALYNARSDNAEVRLLTFVLIGVATPGDLIRDPKRTPFNIGTRVDLEDFTPEEAAPLAAGLEIPEDESQRVLADILRWTGGHPYLTQRLCQTLAVREEGGWNAATIDATVQETFLGDQSERDHNLQFVRDMLIERSPDRIGVLRLYQAIRVDRRPIPNEEQSLFHAHLKLSGVVRRSERYLRLRNRIYAEVFNSAWIRRHWPLSWWQSIPTGVRIAAGFALILLMSLMVVAFILVQALKVSETRRIQAQQLSDQIRGQAIADAAQEAMNRSLPDQALALALAGIQSPMPAPETERILADAAYARGVRLEFGEHQNNVSLARLSSDLRIVASSDYESKVFLWEAATGQQMGVLSYPENVVDITFSPDSHKIAVALAHSIHLYDIVSENESDYLQIDNPSKQTIKNIVFTSEGKTILIGIEITGDGLPLTEDDTGAVIEWNYGRRETKLFTETAVPVKTLVISPNGLLVAWGSDRGSNNNATLGVVNYPSGTDTKLFKVQNGVSVIAFSPNNRQLATASHGNGIDIWDLDQANSMQSFRVTDVVESLSFSPKGDLLASAEQGGLTVRNAITLDAISYWSYPRTKIRVAQFSTDGRSLLSTWGHKLRIWDTTSVHEPQSIESIGYNGVSISEDGRSLLVLHENGIDLIDLINKATIQHLVIPESYSSDPLTDISFSNDGNEIMAVSGWMKLLRWDRHTGRLIQQLQLTPGGIYAWRVGFSPDRTRLLVNSPESNKFEDTATIWDTANGTKLGSFYISFSPFSFAFSRDGRKIAHEDEEYQITLRDSDTGSITRKFVGHEADIDAIAFNNDGTLIATASEDETVRLWNVSTGAEEKRLDLSSVVTAIAFSANDELMLTGGSDGMIRIWEISTWREIRRFTGHNDSIRVAMFTGDSRYVISIARDDTLWFWRLENIDELLQWIADHRFVPILTCEQRARFGQEPLCDAGQQLPATPMPAPVPAPVPMPVPSPYSN